MTQYTPMRLAALLGDLEDTLGEVSGSVDLTMGRRLRQIASELGTLRRIAETGRQPLDLF
jgi:hypothetical protein